MNRRTFLTGLLSTAAAVSVAPGAVAITPRALTDEEFFDLMLHRMNGAYKLMQDQIAQNLYGDSSPGGVATLLYLTDEEPVRFQAVEFGVKVMF